MVTAVRRLMPSRLHATATRQLHASATQGAAREAAGSFIHPDATIGQGVSIGPFCTVGPSARIGDACQLHAGSHVVGDTELGDVCVVLGLRKVYQRVFMPSIPNGTGVEERLAELENESTLLESTAVYYMVESIRMLFAQGRRGICKFRSWNNS